ncbi:MAG TPA: hypothetical protein VFX49_11735 [Chloroflexota bacterium]|nr:hypothetical protein [Chloroflexota bacterium]
MDWLTIAFRGQLRDAVIAPLMAKLEAAEQLGSARCAVTLGDRIFELRATKNRGRYVLTNADLVLVLELGASEGWGVSVEFSGARMAQTPMRDAIRTARVLAAMLCHVDGTRVRRLDLCADVQGFDLNELDGLAWVKPRRAKLAAISTDALEKVFEPGRRTYERGGRVTGVAICPGNCLMLLAYDKREELNALPDDRKRVFEEGIWRDAGWDGEAPIGRVEFRFRSEALKELGARDELDKLEQRLDGLWRYACRKWVRLVDRGSASKLSNCKIAQPWQVVQEHVFRHRDGAAPRVRMRGGATSAHVFGTALSRLAATNSVPRILDFLNEYGSPVDDSEIFRLPTWEARSLLEVEIERVLQECTHAIADDFIRRFRSAHKATAFVRNRARASIARFWTQEEEPAWDSTG